MVKTHASDPEPATKGPKGEEPTERALWWTVSSEAKDRDNDVLTIGGWDLKNFRKNPVVPWAHNYTDLPVARAVQIEIDNEKKRLRMLKQFPTRDEYAFADTVFQLASKKYLKAASVGFIPQEWEQMPEEKDEPAYRRGFIHRKKELLESSIVVVPSNPTALQEAKSIHGIDISPYVEWAEKILDGEVGAGVWIPRKTVEEVIAVVRPKASVIIPSAPLEKEPDMPIEYDDGEGIPIVVRGFGPETVADAPVAVAVAEWRLMIEGLTERVAALESKIAAQIASPGDETLATVEELVDPNPEPEATPVADGAATEPTPNEEEGDDQDPTITLAFDDSEELATEQDHDDDEDDTFLIDTDMLRLVATEVLGAL